MRNFYLYNNTNELDLVNKKGKNRGWIVVTFNKKPALRPQDGSIPNSKATPKFLSAFGSSAIVFLGGLRAGRL